ncbi:MAG: hypothetical protein N2C12_07670 [Planctomycetales bacterium]
MRDRRERPTDVYGPVENGLVPGYETIHADCQRLWECMQDTARFGTLVHHAERDDYIVR